MKSVLIIGMGRFGHHLCMNMVKLGNEVMIVDDKEEKLEDLLPIVTNAKIGDCTNPNVLKALGIGNFDICFVCIGTNFQSSLEITNQLKEMGAKYVVSKATRDIHAKFLLKNGADEVVYPERDIAEKVATRMSANHVFDYVELTDGYGIFEIPVMEEWINKTIREVNFRAKYHVSIIGTRQNNETKLLPLADHLFEPGEHLMIIGHKEHTDKLIKKL